MNPIAQQMFAKNVADANTAVRVGVGVIVKDGSGRILLEKRSDCGLWGLPGGKIEPGESIVAAAVREVREETGLDIRIRRLLGVYSEPSDRIVTYPDNGDVVHLIDILLEAGIVSGQISRSEESEEVRFFDTRALPADIAPPAIAPLRDFLEEKTGTIS
jgi:ADP-ribose pyrophosphatase YjhB (NUDIX family)